MLRAARLESALYEEVEAELSVHTGGRGKPLRFLRRGPLWLGLVSGLRLDLARVDEGA